LLDDVGDPADGSGDQKNAERRARARPSTVLLTVGGRAAPDD